jgi:hypothetical protein
MLPGQPPFCTGLNGNGMQFCLLMNFVLMGILQMDALVFREDELSDFIPKTSFNVTYMVKVVF